VQLMLFVTIFYKMPAKFIRKCVLMAVFALPKV